ncbi:MAG: hypothetical protein AB8B55_00370 [Mariniblastus sp.]
MVIAANQATPTNKPEMDWHNIRPVYQKLQTDFHVLTEPFGIFPSDEKNLDLSNLIGAIDVSDRALDVIVCLERRKQFSDKTIEFLAGPCEEAFEFFDEFALTNEFHDRIGKLKSIIIRLEIQAEFCKKSNQVFEYTEAKRQANSQGEMIRNLVAEWECTGHLPVLILGELSTPKFEKFFFLACSMMPAIDMVQDARADFETGVIRVRPSVLLYLRLLAIFLVPAPLLLWRFPAPLNLIKYAISFLRV